LNQANGYVAGEIARELTDMGRGLSDLQKTILRVALMNRQASEKDDARGHIASYLGLPKRDPMDIRYAEILVVHFKFPIKRTWKHDEADLSDHEVAKKSAGGKKFNKQRIGEKRYASALAALSRAFLRLQARGLIECFSGTFARWSGGQLTDQGIEVASSLTVNLRDNWATI
jgi:hypothetical protein